MYLCKKYLFGLGCLFLGLAGLTHGSEFGNAARNSLFQPAVQAFEAAHAARAERLAPKKYAKARQLLQMAIREYTAGAALKQVEAKVKQSIGLFNEARELAQKAQRFFAQALKARSAALTSGAPASAPKIWQQGESKLAAGIKKAGGAGREKLILKAAKEAEQYFRDAELLAIKAKYLATTRDLLKTAAKQKVKKYAPRTLTRAQNLASIVETHLQANRYEVDRTLDLVRQAEDEARHALYLADQLKQLGTKQKTAEELILDAEQALQQIAAKFNITATFDKGLAAVAGRIIAVVDARGRLQEKVYAFQSGFAFHQAQLMLLDDNIIIRLYGIRFGDGRAAIDAQSFALLEQVQRVIAAFPDRAIRVEGHTDSRGSAGINTKLSQARAAAVRQFLIGNFLVDGSRIKAFGFGESRPLADNQTPEGRRKNRRIDIIIQPRSH